MISGLIVAFSLGNHGLGAFLPSDCRRRACVGSCALFFLSKKSFSFGAGRLGYTPTVPENREAEPADLWNGANSIGPLVYAVLKAQTYQRDVDYILRDKKIIILSQNTGRAMEKSRWNEGMHQVIDEPCILSA